MSNSRAGFTLIELLVVIGIIGILAAALLPQIVSSQESANIAADQANLRHHFASLTVYRNKYKRPPSWGGSQFVIAPWVKGVVEHTEAEFDRFWVPGYNDPQKETLREAGVDALWQSIDDVTSQDTHYAGRGRANLRGKIFSGKEVLIADDNEFGAMFLDQTINVLMGDGTVKSILLDELRELGYEGDGKEEWFEVGPDSPHPDLQKLEK